MKKTFLRARHKITTIEYVKSHHRGAYKLLWEHGCVGWGKGKRKAKPEQKDSLQGFPSKITASAVGVGL